jgi:hypothetical protein
LVSATIVIANCTQLLAGGHGSMGGGMSHASMGASLSHAAIHSAPSMGISRSLAPPQGPVNLRQLNAPLGGTSTGGGASPRILTRKNGTGGGSTAAGSGGRTPPPVVTPDHSTPDRTPPPVVTPVHTKPISLVGVGVPDRQPIASGPPNVLPTNPPGNTVPRNPPGNSTYPSPNNGRIVVPRNPPGNTTFPAPGTGSNVVPRNPPTTTYPLPGNGGNTPIYPGNGTVGVTVGIGAGPSAGGDYTSYPTDYAVVVSGADEAAAVQPKEYMNVAAPAIDLELVDIRLVDAGSLSDGVGPRFRLFCRNNGTLEAPKFHVSVMANLGSALSEKAYLVTVESVGIKPGKTQTVDVQMPPEILKMKGSQDHWPRPFDLLGAMLDSDESLTETNEKNNTLVLTRDSIKPVAGE